jgi:two-component system, LytTR family, response regulator
MSDTFKAIIIDDESDARDTLSVLLKDYCPEIELLSAEKDLPSGVKSIYKLKPDVVFLDIEMPEYSGLEILEFFDPEHIYFQIIFTTAYSEYAVQAFELAAVDYLLKPIQINLLQLAVQKLKNKQSQDSSANRLSALKNIMSPNNEPLRIVLPVADGFNFIQSNDIVYLKADRSYTDFYLKNGSCITVSKNLKEYDDLLNHRNFFRIHRSYLINMNEITQYLKRDGGFVVVSNGAHIPIASDRKTDFLANFKIS